MKPITILMIDDEEAARKRVERLLTGNKDFVIEKSCSSGMEALLVLSEKKIDLLLLDIEMPGISGLELVNKIEESKRPSIVFITAYDEYAVQAFEYYAIDYLLKPFSNERFEKMLERVKLQITGKKAANIPWPDIMNFMETHQLPDNRISVKTGKKYHFIEPADIAYICADGNYCGIRLCSGDKFVHRDTITHLASILPADRFIRIHHSYIVAIASVVQVNRVAFAEMEVKMTDGKLLKVSRKYKDLVKKMIR
jgi:two-component system, LytTR family, response regulator